MSVEACGVDLQTAVEVVRMHVLDPSVPCLLLQRSTDKLQPSLVEVEAELVSAGHPDEHRGCVSNDAKTLLAFLKRLVLLSNTPLALKRLGRVNREAASVDEVAVFKEDIGVDLDMPDLSVFAA